MLTLEKLMDEYGGNGFWLDDAGSGCGGLTWMPWDDDTENEYGCIEMTKNPGKHPDKTNENKNPEYEYISDWIIDGEGDNPYRYYVMF